MKFTNCEGNEPKPSAPPAGFATTGVLFGGAALLLLTAIHVVVPAIVTATGIEPILAWFIAAGFFVFVPLIVVATLVLRFEKLPRSSSIIRDRLRFHRMTSMDWIWSFLGFGIIGVLGFVIAKTLRHCWPPLRLSPSFMEMEPLTPDRYWILAVWLPFFLINILSEELLWRGVLLPRQEQAFGRWAWFVHGVGWLCFHLPFGLTLLALLCPIVLILPYLVQQQRNSSIGVMIHASFNGLGFIAVAFGLA